MKTFKILVACEESQAVLKEILQLGHKDIIVYSCDIQPYEYGDGYTKKTGLWLWNLPKLTPTNIVEGREQYCWKLPPSKDRAKLRSKTYPGIAKAMEGDDTMIKFTDYEKITDYLKAMRSILLILTKYNIDLDDKEWVHLCIAYNRLEQQITEEYQDLDIHFHRKSKEEKLKSIDFLLKLFEIGRNARVTI